MISSVDQDNIICINKKDIPIFKDNNELIMIYYNKLKINQPIIPNIEISYVYNFEKYIKDLLNSYENENAIIEQFEKDYCRCNIIINDITYTNLEEIKSNISNNTLLILLCTQSSFAYPMEKISEYYNLYNKCLMLMDFKNNITGRIYITINTNDDIINLEMKKRLYIQEIIYEEEIISDIKKKYIVDINLSFIFNKNISLNNYHYLEKEALMNWKIIDVMEK